MPEPTRILINTDSLPEPKNIDGVLGEKCNNCGGYGYTMGIKGKSLSCEECERTGVKLPTRRELQTQISEIRKDLQMLRKAVLATLEAGGLKIKTPVKKNG